MEEAPPPGTVRVNVNDSWNETVKIRSNKGSCHVEITTKTADAEFHRFMHV